jgi:phosphomannomutase
VAYNYDMLNWKPVIEQKMQMLKKYKNKTIGDLTITSKYWNLKGDCLEWHLINGGWIKFRMSGTEPKFKIYYNLFGDTQSSLTNQYNKLNTIFQKMLMEK